MGKKWLLAILLVLACSVGIFSFALCLLHPKFGRLPAGSRLERVRRSSHYAAGQFQNQTPTPSFSGEGGTLSSLWDFLFVTHERTRPLAPLPMLKTDLKALGDARDVVVWLGHSSCFMRLGGKSGKNGKKILIDPVFNSHAAPFPFFNRAFEEYPYGPEDMPEIDCLVISHDHWDHLDYETLSALKDKIKSVICPLGVGAHLERWGFDPKIVHEADWYETVVLAPDWTVHVLPARHFSGRWLQRNRTLWAGFLFESEGRRVFYSGDSGYGPHFAEIGKKFGPIDLAIMENGQYNANWKYVHMMPEEAVQGTLDVRAKALLPVHSGRFSISTHPWDDPYRRVYEASRGKDFRLLTPRIGEVVDLQDPNQTFSLWWEM